MDNYHTDISVRKTISIYDIKTILLP